MALCLIGAAALWRVGATLDGGRIVADQAMNSAAVPGPEAAVVRPPVPPPVGPSLLPAVAKAGSASQRVNDPRVSEIRRAINRCNPLIPFSRSTITVKTRPSGKTLILFGEHEARGQLGTCVARIVARTRIAKGRAAQLQTLKLRRSSFQSGLYAPPSRGPATH